MNNFSTLSENITKFVESHNNPKFWTGVLTQDEFDPYEKIAWMQRNWMMSIYAAIFYLALIFGLREFMKERKPFDLKVPLILWNLSLAIFSIKGASVSIVQGVKLLGKLGFHGSVCAPIDYYTPELWYWGTLFIFSKIVELGDTLFLVLRKRPLIFLHWYHHISVLIFCWLTFKDMMSTGGWAGMINYTVHACMYTYFTISALGWKVPKPIAMSVTAVQLLQMIVMLGIHSYAAQQKFMGKECAGVSNSHLWFAFGLFTSYALLFGKFFYKAYFCGVSKSKRKLK